MSQTAGERNKIVRAVNNHVARSLYAAHGFTEAGLRRNYYEDGTDALILRSDMAASGTDR